MPLVRQRRPAPLRVPGMMRATAARRRIDRRTAAIGAVAFTSVGAVLAGEVANVWRRGSAPLPTQTDDILGAAEEAARETVEVVLEGYRDVPDRENALLNLLLSFVLGLGAVRGTTHVIHARGKAGPFRDLMLGERHIHHFVPGIGMALLAGGASIVTRDEGVDKWLAIPFGVGAALTLDESALLLELDDVYWTEEGVISLQIALAAAALLASLVLGLRLLRRGERLVLDAPHAASPPDGQLSSPAPAPGSSPAPPPSR